jgi:hypothetical protein
MPRHRQGNIPKHRAGPPENSGRRPGHGRARHAARAVTPDDDPPGAGPPTLPYAVPPADSWPTAAHLTSGYPAPPAAVPPAPRLAQRRRAARGRPAAPGAAPPRRVSLLVTPWFAAGAGFVIAAAMALNTGPRTFLTYRPNATKCSGCSSAPGSLATSRPGIQIRSGQADGTGRPGGPVGPAVTVQRGPADHGIFYVTFIVPAGQAHNGWRLRFELPGRSVNQVWNALWQPDATGDGGVASIPAEAGSTVGRTFEVSAVGAWTRPGGCVLNGHACQFVMAP